MKTRDVALVSFLLLLSITIYLLLAVKPLTGRFIFATVSENYMPLSIIAGIISYLFFIWKKK